MVGKSTSYVEYSYIQCKNLVGRAGCGGGFGSMEKVTLSHASISRALSPGRLGVLIRRLVAEIRYWGFPDKCLYGQKQKIHACHSIIYYVLLSTEITAFSPGQCRGGGVGGRGGWERERGIGLCGGHGQCSRHRTDVLEPKSLNVLKPNLGPHRLLLLAENIWLWLRR